MTPNIWKRLFNMPQIKKPKPAKKPVSRVPVKVKPKRTKNPAAYYQCMKSCCQNKPKGKKITQVAQECKHNALSINAKMSAAKAQAAQKIKAGYEQMGKGLAELIEASK
jgi:hypothetical protein